jgi:hypothetical protein
VKGRIVHGAIDNVGYQAVEHPHYYSDLHATILRQLGLDQKKMEILGPGPNHETGERRRRAHRRDSELAELFIRAESKRPPAGFKLLLKGNLKPRTEAEHEFTICLAKVIRFSGLEADGGGAG